MHAYLIIGSDTQTLAKKLDAKVMEFPIEKIEDTRALNNLIRLSFTKKTLIVCRDIQNATTEALNAFLKNLEEPQENIYFALTTPSESLVLQTIVSRCQIIKNADSAKNAVDREKITLFLKMSQGEKLKYFDKIKDRAEAIKFVEDLMHILSEENIFVNMEIVLKTHTRLKSNGNVNLQMANLTIQYN